MQILKIQIIIDTYQLKYMQICGKLCREGVRKMPTTLKIECPDSKCNKIATAILELLKSHELTANQAHEALNLTDKNVNHAAKL